MLGGTKENDMDKEVTMGLRWTFMPVNWRKLEPLGPVNLSEGIPEEWKELDEFVKAAERRKLNILFQAPVVGGSAEGPPDWAGRREPGKSAPERMDAAAEFAGKLARRYKPGRTLALEQGWGNRFGVRAWEIDNEPEMYRTHWKNQAGDYAQMATKVSAKIKEADPLALLLLPGVASGEHKTKWLEQALNAHGLAGSPAYRSNAVSYSIGPVTDVVSFHVYEGDSAFKGRPRPSRSCSTRCEPFLRTGKSEATDFITLASKSFGTRREISISSVRSPKNAAPRGAFNSSHARLPRGFAKFVSWTPPSWKLLQSELTSKLCRGLSQWSEPITKSKLSRETLKLSPIDTRTKADQKVDRCGFCGWRPEIRTQQWKFRFPAKW